jgi:hypothetical protein
MTGWITGGILARMDSIPAIFDAGVFRPLEPVDLADGTRAEVIPLSPTAPASVSLAEAAQPPTWPPNYFDQTAGALASEDFERPPQGDVPRRENW